MSMNGANQMKIFLTSTTAIALLLASCSNGSAYDFGACPTPSDPPGNGNRKMVACIKEAGFPFHAIASPGTEPAYEAAVKVCYRSFLITMVNCAQEEQGLPAVFEPDGKPIPPNTTTIDEMFHIPGTPEEEKAAAERRAAAQAKANAEAQQRIEEAKKATALREEQAAKEAAQKKEEADRKYIEEAPQREAAAKAAQEEAAKQQAIAAEAARIQQQEQAAQRGAQAVARQAEEAAKQAAQAAAKIEKAARDEQVCKELFATMDPSHAIVTARSLGIKLKLGRAGVGLCPSVSNE
jgi:hypothetical protein